MRLITGLFHLAPAGLVSKERWRPAIVRRSRHVLLYAFAGLVAVSEALGSLVTARRRHSLDTGPAGAMEENIFN